MSLTIKGWPALLLLIFLVLKLTRTIAWSWAWVLSPIWIPLLLALLIATAGVL